MTSSRLADVDAVALYDDYCVRFLRLAGDIDYRIAQTRLEQEAHYRLRYEQVVTAGWRQPEEFAEGLERDEYDDEAVIINGWHGQSLVITGRLVFPAVGRRLPMEAEFDLRIEPVGRLVECGRLIQVGALQKQFPRAFLGIIGAAWQATRARGYMDQGGVMTATVVRLYRMIGIQQIKLAEAHEHWGEKRFPVKMDLPATVETFQKRGLYAD